MVSADARLRHPHLFTDHGRLPDFVCDQPLQQGHAGPLQVCRLVGWPGRLFAFVGMAPLNLYGSGRLHEPPQIPGHDALRHGHPRHDAGVFPHPGDVRCKPLQNARGRQRHCCSRRHRRWSRTRSFAAVLDHGHPSSHAVPRLRRVYRALRFRDRVADHQTKR